MCSSHLVTRFVLLCHLIAVGNAFVGSRRTQQTTKDDNVGHQCNNYEATQYFPSPMMMAKDPNNNNEDSNKPLDEKLDDFLDAPLFDPDAPSNDNNWFANLVKNDYESAEALYAGAIIIFGVVVSQELLRLVKYGDAYVPFSSASGGQLF